MTQVGAWGPWVIGRHGGDFTVQKGLQSCKIHPCVDQGPFGAHFGYLHNARLDSVLRIPEYVVERHALCM